MIPQEINNTVYKSSGRMCVLVDSLFSFLVCLSPNFVSSLDLLTDLSVHVPVLDDFLLHTQAFEARAQAPERAAAAPSFLALGDFLHAQVTLHGNVPLACALDHFQVVLYGSHPRLHLQDKGEWRKENTERRMENGEWITNNK